MSRVSRRQILISIGGLAGVATAYVLLGEQFFGGYGLLTDIAAAKTIGEHHLRENGEPNLAGVRKLLVGPDDDVARAVRAAIRADFEHGRIVVVRDWRLAQTEANLCALAVRGG